MGANVKIVQPRLGRSEQPWEPTYQYRCGNGHELATDQAMTRCPLAWCGTDLVRFGRGSKGPRCVREVEEIMDREENAR